MPIPTITDKDFDSYVLASEGPVLVDFWGPDCAACRALEPTLVRMSDELQEAFNFVGVNVVSSPALAQRYSVRGLPTLKIFKDGKPVATRTGAAPYALIKTWIEEAGAD